MGPPHPTHPLGQLQWVPLPSGSGVMGDRHPGTEGELQMPTELPMPCPGTKGCADGCRDCRADSHLPRVARGWVSPAKPYLLQKAHGQHGVGSVENVVECQKPALIQRLEGNREKL